MLKQVLYLSYDGLTDPLGQSQILPYLGGLSFKYKITIVSFEKKRSFSKGYDRIMSFCKKHELDWIPLMYHKSPPLVSTIYDLFQLKKTVKRLHHQRKFSIVHCRSYITSLVGLWMKRHYSIKFIFDMRGFWADERVEGGLWNLNNPIYAIVYKFFKKKEKEFVKNSDQIISLTNNAKKEILAWGLSDAITVIPCCVDLDLFNPEKIELNEQQRLKHQLKIAPEDFVLLYLGSWGTWYMTKEMLDFFAELKIQKSKSKFLIVTGDRVDLNNYPFAHDVIICEALRTEVPLYITLADSSVFFIKATYSKKASSATKMAEIMAMNVPVITNSGWGDTEEIVNSSAGLLFDPGISTIQLNKINKSHTNTREYCSINLSLDSGIAKYADVYSKI